MTVQERLSEKLSASGLVRFHLPTLHGQGTMAGRVQLVRESGLLEVKGQDGGYYAVKVDDLLPPKDR